MYNIHFLNKKNGSSSPVLFFETNHNKEETFLFVGNYGILIIDIIYNAEIRSLMWYTITFIIR